MFHVEQCLGSDPCEKPRSRAARSRDRPGSFERESPASSSASAVGFASSRREARHRSSETLRRRSRSRSRRRPGVVATPKVCPPTFSIRSSRTVAVRSLQRPRDVPQKGGPLLPGLERASRSGQAVRSRAAARESPPPTRCQQPVRHEQLGSRRATDSRACDDELLGARAGRSGWCWRRQRSSSERYRASAAESRGGRARGRSRRRLRGGAPRSAQEGAGVLRLARHAPRLSRRPRA